VLVMVHGNNQPPLLSFASAKESSKECALLSIEKVTDGSFYLN
jgi:hypothetical protein